MGLIRLCALAQNPTGVGLLRGCGERSGKHRVPVNKPVKNRRSSVISTFHSECRS